MIQREFYHEWPCEESLLATLMQRGSVRAPSYLSRVTSKAAAYSFFKGRSSRRRPARHI